MLVYITAYKQQLQAAEKISYCYTTDSKLKLISSKASL